MSMGRCDPKRVRSRSGVGSCNSRSPGMMTRSRPRWSMVVIGNFTLHLRQQTVKADLDEVMPPAFAAAIQHFPLAKEPDPPPHFLQATLMAVLPVLSTLYCPAG